MRTRAGIVGTEEDFERRIVEAEAELDSNPTNCSPAWPRITRSTPRSSGTRSEAAHTCFELAQSPLPSALASLASIPRRSLLARERRSARARDRARREGHGPCRRAALARARGTKAPGEGPRRTGRRAARHGHKARAQPLGANAATARRTQAAQRNARQEGAGRDNARASNAEHVRPRTPRGNERGRLGRNLPYGPITQPGVKRATPRSSAARRQRQRRRPATKMPETSRNRSASRASPGERVGDATTLRLDGSQEDHRIRTLS